MKYIVSRNSQPSVLSRDFDDLFSNLWSNWGYPAVKSPAVDIWEDEKAYMISAELPGFSEKDVDVHVDKHVLRISSVCEAENEKKEEKESPKYLIRERYCSSFERSFTLPEGVDEENISGEFKNGVLTLTVPKLPEKQPKKIEVKIA
ncbi:MAG: Hsp20/alpha crystallin family protein [Sphaerochaetaceae bacterium]|nr:Hsp20/alpha crystallin family protein [Sphaerochaetaceae bacterium]MDC7247371.1 Hsp20/alpha crystallin family protein [Sphaerochaetaceae bacterium]